MRAGSHILSSVLSSYGIGSSLFCFFLLPIALIGNKKKSLSGVEAKLTGYHIVELFYTIWFHASMVFYNGYDYVHAFNAHKKVTSRGSTKCGPCVEDYSWCSRCIHAKNFGKKTKKKLMKLMSLVQISPSRFSWGQNLIRKQWSP